MAGYVPSRGKIIGNNDARAFFRAGYSVDRDDEHVLVIRVSQYLAIPEDGAVGRFEYELGFAVAVDIIHGLIVSLPYAYGSRTG